MQFSDLTSQMQGGGPELGPACPETLDTTYHVREGPVRELCGNMSCGCGGGTGKPCSKPPSIAHGLVLLHGLHTVCPSCHSFAYNRPTHMIHIVKDTRGRDVRACGGRLVVATWCGATPFWPTLASCRSLAQVVACDSAAFQRPVTICNVYIIHTALGGA